MAPEVHEFTQSTSFALENTFISSSNAFTLGPEVIQPERNESTTSLMTASSIRGRKWNFHDLLYRIILNESNMNELSSLSSFFGTSNDAEREIFLLWTYIFDSFKIIRYSRS